MYIRSSFAIEFPSYVIQNFIFPNVRTFIQNTKGEKVVFNELLHSLNISIKGFDFSVSSCNSSHNLRILKGFTPYLCFYKRVVILQKNFPLIEKENKRRFIIFFPDVFIFFKENWLKSRHDFDGKTLIQYSKKVIHKQI